MLLLAPCASRQLNAGLSLASVWAEDPLSRAVGLLIPAIEGRQRLCVFVSYHNNQKEPN